jgi:predicted acylesterase/phospholipase RssA/outer membrane translocation and assembly module TamA
MKRRLCIQAISLFLSILIFHNLIHADPPRLALVLSGGGARGLAQIGVIQALEEASIHPDLIVATSMGAIIGSLYATGMCADSMRALVKNTVWDDFFQDGAKRRTLFVSQKVEPVTYLFEIRFGQDFMPIMPQSISRGQSFFDLLTARVSGPLFRAGTQFDSLPIPIRIVSTDIVSGQCVVFARGNLPAVVRASCAVPLAFAPVSLDGMLLMDGGLMTNIPVQQAKTAGAGSIIAVDVTSPMWEKGDLNNPIRLVNQVIAIGMEHRKALERAIADVIIRPELAGFRNTDFSQIDTLIDRGYAAARGRMAEIRRCLDSRRPVVDEVKRAAGPDDSVDVPFRWENQSLLSAAIIDSVERGLRALYGAKISRKHLLGQIDTLLYRNGFVFAKAAVLKDAGRSAVTIDPGVIHSIEVRGNRKTSTRLILSASNLVIGEVLTRSLVEKTIASLYATDLFNTVNIEVLPDNQVVLVVEEKEYLRMRVGARFDEYHFGEAYIQPAFENLFGSGMRCALHLQYGLRREKYAVELAGSPLFSADWANNIKIQAYIAREKITKDSINLHPVTVFDSSIEDSVPGVDTIYEHDEMTLRKAGILAMVGTQIGRSTMVDGGLRLERYKVTRSNTGAFEDPIGPTFKQGIRYLMLRLTVDNLDRFPFPQKGQKHYISVGGASDVIGGTESFLKVQGAMGFYGTLRKRHTLYPQCRFVWTNKPLHDVEVERVYVGGAMLEEKYRDIGVYNYIPFMGLRPRSLNGDILFLMHMTYRFLVIKNIYSLVCLDWGKVWDQPDFTFSSSTGRDFLDHAPLGLGVGVAWQTPVGPMHTMWSRIVRGTGKESVDIVKENVFYLSLGYDF